ncbi:hypothetical protein EJ05DRAFT_247805 [Pseudovirgaria hyperparasitica]|uniref:Uncharacterized protein n=1 Tax=Pseudovirgaria hyperparasitica TaxID=470096 RepID=A0A6A6WFW7_9PEZI|nr:uncharacterized protein EJ05DRAFT_247805 [Pseudovirgaria hyperparasitica]KAF2760954.1 hypothetical protein EJ05DRAFT_247805 [Pseudovirgaria hyperparasitica]
MGLLSVWSRQPLFYTVVSWSGQDLSTLHCELCWLLLLLMFSWNQSRAARGYGEGWSRRKNGHPEQVPARGATGTETTTMQADIGRNCNDLFVHFKGVDGWTPHLLYSSSTQ